MTAEIIGDNGMRYSVRSQFEGRQRRALIARPSFVHPYMDSVTGVMRHVDRRKRRSPIDCGEPTGVAMGEDIHRSADALGQPLDDPEAMHADRAALFDVGITDHSRFAIRRSDTLPGRHSGKGVAHSRQRPRPVSYTHLTLPTN